MKTFRKSVSYVLVAAMAVSAMPAQASATATDVAAINVTATAAPGGIVSTGQMLQQGERSEALTTVEAFVAREQVAAQLAALGVDPAEINARVAALSEADLQRLAASMGDEPAGGGVLNVIGVLLIVLLVLELLGVTNVFTGMLVL